MGLLSVIQPTTPQQHFLCYKLMATYHPFCHCQIREWLAQIMPNISSFQPPPSPTTRCTVTTMSATATTMDTDNNNNNNDNDNDNKEQQQQWHLTHNATTKLLTWHAYGLTEHAMSTVTFWMTMTMSMMPGPHDEGQGPPTTMTAHPWQLTSAQHHQHSTQTTTAHKHPLPTTTTTLDNNRWQAPTTTLNNNKQWVPTTTTTFDNGQHHHHNAKCWNSVRCFPSV